MNPAEASASGDGVGKKLGKSFNNIHPRNPLILKIRDSKVEGLDRFLALAHQPELRQVWPPSLGYTFKQRRS